ncbi:MAG: hypothetical protein JNL11_17660 [Bdellovibrionaceae bacterium]|nr:hypothetical protein [Pseudobdellovibrionaceae bacterium]
MKTYRAFLVCICVLATSIFSFGQNRDTYELKGKLLSSPDGSFECKVNIVVIYNDSKGWHNEITFYTNDRKSEVFSSETSLIVGTHHLKHFQGNSSSRDMLTIERNSNNSINAQFNSGGQPLKCQNMTL